MSLVDRVVEAHGGLDRWRRTPAVTIWLSSGGLAFAAKGQRTALHNVRATIHTTGQAVDLEGSGWSRRFEAGIPRPSGMRWSVDDIAAFAAAALWTYVALPFVLPELDVEEADQRLIVRFPDAVRTHSQRQVLHIDSSGLIKRHDYTASDFGRWARARQEVAGYEDVDGLKIARRRRVRPSAWPHLPLLVWIDIADAATGQHG